MVAITLKLNPQKPDYYIIHEIRQMKVEPVNSYSQLKSHAWRPPTDVYETESAIIVRVEIAGMDENNFSVILDGSYLSIRGGRGETPERRAYHQMEIRFGEFSTEVDLPYQVISEEIEASYNNGFLKVVLPKARPRKIQVED